MAINQRRGNTLTAAGPVDSWIISFTDSKGEKRANVVHRGDVAGNYLYAYDQRLPASITVANDLILQMEEKIGKVRTADRIRALEERIEALEVELNRRRRG